MRAVVLLLVFVGTPFGVARGQTESESRPVSRTSAQLDPVKLDGLRAAFEKLENAAPSDAAAAWRALEARTDGLWSDSGEYLVRLAGERAGWGKDTLTKLAKSLAALDGARPIFAALLRLGVPATTSGMLRGRLYFEVPDEAGQRHSCWQPVWAKQVSDVEVEYQNDWGRTFRHRLSDSRPVFWKDSGSERWDRWLLGPAEIEGQIRFREAPFDDEVREILRESSRASIDGGRFIHTLYWEVLSLLCVERGQYVLAAMCWERVSEFEAPTLAETENRINDWFRTSGLTALHGKKPRSLAAAHFRSALEWKSDQPETKAELEWLARSTEEMAREDAGRKPLPPTPTDGQRVEDLVYHVRDIAAVPDGSPGDFSVFNEPDNAAHALRDVGKTAIPALLPLLKDQRPTRSHNWWRMDLPFSFRAVPISDAASEILARITGRRLTKEQWPDWWAANRDRTEDQWWLDELASGEDDRVAEAVARIAQRSMQPSAAVLFEAIAKIREPWVQARAIASVAGLPARELVENLAPYLSASAEIVRFEAARALQPHDRPRAVAIVMNLLRTVTPDDDGSLTNQAIEWLVTKGGRQGTDGAIELLKTGTPFQKQTILEALASGPRESGDAILSAFGDQTVRESTVIGSTGALVDPRIADLAGFALSRLLGMEKQFEWTGSRDHRDDNLRRLESFWKGTGTKGAARESAPVVDRDQLGRLLAAVLSDDPSVRESAWPGLARLGSGASKSLDARIRESEGETRRRLEAAGRFCANIVTRVRTDGAPVDLGSQIGHLVTADGLRRAVGEPFSKDPTWRMLRVGISRKAGGQGTWIDVQVEVDWKNTRSHELTSNFECGGSSGESDPESFPKFVLDAWDQHVTAWLDRVRSQPADRDLHLSVSWRKH